jgi:hypothetical protein
MARPGGALHTNSFRNTTSKDLFVPKYCSKLVLYLVVYLYSLSPPTTWHGRS